MLEDCRLYLITGVRPDLADFLEAAVRGGVDVVQVREKTLADRELLPALEQARAVTRRLGIPLDSAHRAASDAEATGRVLLALASQMPERYGELIRLQGQYAGRQVIKTDE